MKAISKAAQHIFNRLTAGLKVGESRTFDNAKGAFMALHVERLTETRYSLAHYFEQNGDLVPDPDMEFWMGPDCRAYPVNMTQIYRFELAVEFGEDGQPARFDPRSCRNLASFAGVWLRNIAHQQGV